MIVLISPAKTLDFEDNSSAEFFTLPRFTDEAARLMEVLRKKSPRKLMELQQISHELAALNYERNQIWQETHHEGNGKQAISAFKGDVYQGLLADDFTQEDYLFAQDHLRILSGLYGILQPLDLIQPYRLEMGTPLKTTRGKNLYEYWKMRINQQISDEMNHNGYKWLIHLASEEYAKAAHLDKIHSEVIQPVFMEEKDGERKVISIFAKRARGLMTRFIIKHRIYDPDLLKGFDVEGYVFDPRSSSDKTWYFVRLA